MKYKTVQVKSTLFKIPAWFFLFRPVLVPYNKITEKAEKAGFKVKKETKNGLDGIWEKGMAFGKGWIAIEVEPQESGTNNKNLIQINGEFKLYKHTGSYKKLGKVYRQIMKENPKAKEFHSIYANDPHIVEPEKLKTYILFR